MLRTFLRRLLASDKGATAIEYGLIVALIALTMFAGASKLAVGTHSMWGNVSDKVINH